jgi:hypothetical protein
MGERPDAVVYDYVVSIVMAVVMIVLFLSELKSYLYVHTHEHMVVDSTINEKLQINVDVSFLAINCKGATQTH